MLVDIVGHNIVEYTKDGVDKTFAKIFCVEHEATGNITSGRRVFEVITSEKYAFRLYNAYTEKRNVHISWDKHHKPFLYIK